MAGAEEQLALLGLALVCPAAQSLTLLRPDTRAAQPERLLGFLQPL